MKKNQKKYVGIGIALVSLLAIFFFYSGSASGNINNGYWNEATQECWSSEDRPAGVAYDSENSDAMFTSCCFNLEGRQIDCNNPNKFIGSNFLAVYGVGGSAGQPGNFYVSHVVTVTNDGSVPIDKAWIDSASWSPSNSVLSTAYARIVGSTSTYAVALPVGTSTDFPTQTIALQDIGGVPGSPITYNLDMLVKASAYAGQLDSSRTISGSITVEKEEIGFKVDIGWGA